MNCLRCGSPGVHITGGDVAKGTRQRECPSCGHRWQTVEIPMAELQGYLQLVESVKDYIRENGAKG